MTADDYLYSQQTDPEFDGDAAREEADEKDADGWSLRDAEAAFWAAMPTQTPKADEGESGDYSPPCCKCGKPSCFQRGNYIPFKSRAFFYCQACFEQTFPNHCAQCGQPDAECTCNPFAGWTSYSPPSDAERTPGIVCADGKFRQMEYSEDVKAMLRRARRESEAVRQ